MSERLQVNLCAVLLAIIVIWLALYQQQQAWLLDAYDYSREQLWQEPWRILSAHALHIDLQHAALNAAGLILITVFFARHFSVRTWLNAVIIITVICSLVVWMIGRPERFVGLSGLLHGMLLMSLLLEWSLKNYATKAYLYPLVVALIGLKTLLEIAGWLPSWLSINSGGDYGFIHLGGLVGGVIAWRLHRKQLAAFNK